MTHTAAGVLLDALPCELRAASRGDEVHFSVPLKAVPEKDAKQMMDPGTVCFWLEGSSLALPFARRWHQKPTHAGRWRGQTFSAKSKATQKS
jgi:hypothetical protein